jgi:hypothetical protein
MKINRRSAATILLILSCSLSALAQGAGSAQMARFAEGGVVFQYPATWTLSDKSSADNHHLVLELKGTSAQIMVLVERTPSTRPGERGDALRSRTTAFADLMTKQLEKVGATVQRTEVSIEAGGVEAEGLRLRAAPGGQPGSVEVYSFVLGGRIVMLTLLRPDRDAPAAAPAWTAVRSSLRIGASTASSTPTPSSPIITTAPATSSTRPAKFVGFDPGQVTGSSYTNNFFGFRLTIPFGWRVQEQDVKDMLQKTGRDLIKTDNPQANARLDSSISNTVNMLTVFKYAVGASPEFNASLICGAEWLPNPSMSAGQYMMSARGVLERSQQGQYSFKPLTRETVGGTEFTVMEVELPSSIRQKYYAAIKKDYALFFVLTYASDEDEAVLRQALRSVRFS